MGKWIFKATPKAKAVLDKAVAEMVHIFGITEDEAIGRTNQEYQRGDLNEGYAYFDNPHKLALSVCHGDYWWLSEQPLQLKPYPEPSMLEQRVDWAFRTDSESDAFLRQIALEMVRRFRISVDESVARINSEWQHLNSLCSEDMSFAQIAHELYEHWACDIYFGNDSDWCLKDNAPPPQQF